MVAKNNNILYIIMNSIDAPNGYRIVRIGVKGRKPTLNKIPLDKMTPQQRKDFKYREKTKEKRLAYQREYYRRKKANASQAYPQA